LEKTASLKRRWSTWCHCRTRGLGRCRKG